PPRGRRIQTPTTPSIVKSRFTQPARADVDRVEEHALANLDRSNEAFVAHYRDDIKQGNIYKPEAYNRMPIWVAVEAFSFGSLSRLIEASKDSGVLDDIAESMSTSRRLLPGQVKSFVYLRNRVAHCAQLWNHRVLDVPGLQPKTARRVKQRYRNFSDHSIYKILVALDDVATRSGISGTWLQDTVEPILNKNPLFARGIAEPARYGEMAPTPRTV
uniref:Abi family protein n=1 Tax=uncultured Tessaracoccus sp. TaxID=905023 RepID=UPI002635AA12